MAVLKPRDGPAPSGPPKPGVGAADSAKRAAQRKAAAGQTWDFSNCLVVVAHPDDETLWAGGTILLHPETRWTIITLCRKSDAERALKFERVMKMFGARGLMGDLDDGPEQTPQSERDVKKAILDLLPMDRYDLIMTHSRWGEYTRHLRHEETAKAVLGLRNTDELPGKLVWMFAYEDGGGKYPPKPVRDADTMVWLPANIWQQKLKIITEVYGFAPDSFEARTCPKQEAFWAMGTR